MLYKSLTVGALAALAAAAPTKDGNLEARQAGVPPGNACGPVRRETRLVDDGSPKQWTYEVQLTVRRSSLIHLSSFSDLTTLTLRRGA